ncbi:MAG: flagellar filament capping protein FliD, partial [Nitrospirae bacterium]|nr:flagellar filament capping protein FliD [Nitrospirota bacterium]
AAGAAGAATYKYSTDGGITFKGSNGATYSGANAITTQASQTNYIDGNASSNSTNEGVKVSFGSGTLAADDTFSIDVFNPTLVSAQDAVLQVGNLTFSRDSNTVTDAIQGLTLNLLKADSTQTIDIKVQTDTSEIKKKIKDFIAGYNASIKFVNDQLTADPKNATPKPLLGEVNALLIKKQLQDTITALVPGSSSTFNSLSRIGITSSKTSGQLSLDDSKLSAALEDNVTNVTRLFAGVGVSSDANVEYVSKTSSTQPGVYSVAVSTAPTKATVTGSTAVPSAGILAAENLTVSLYSNATKTGDTPLAATVSLAAGSKASDIVNALNTAFATKGIKASASKTSDNKVKITATNYGDDSKLQAVSNQAATDQSGIGTTTLSNQGVDIAGLINGHGADGVGEVLTARSGFPEAGLKVKVPVNTTGLFGNVTLSSGAADRLTAFLDRTTKLKGSSDTRQQGINTTLKTIDADIARKTKAINRLEVTLTSQFNRLEALLGQFKTQSETVTNALGSLSNLATTISRR